MYIDEGYAIVYRARWFHSNSLEEIAPRNSGILIKRNIVDKRCGWHTATSTLAHQKSHPAPGEENKGNLCYPAPREIPSSREWGNSLSAWVRSIRTVFSRSFADASGGVRSSDKGTRPKMKATPPLPPLELRPSAVPIAAGCRAEDLIAPHVEMLSSTFVAPLGSGSKRTPPCHGAQETELDE